MDHLNEKAMEYLALPTPQRIEKIKTPVWIGHPRAEEIQERLSDLFNHPRCGRMSGLLIYGEAESGKSALLEEFASTHNQHCCDEPNLPVFMVQAPYKADERAFFSICMEKLNAPHRINDHTERLRMQLSTILERLGTRLFFIDEIHNLVTAAVAKQRIFLNMLKYLSNDLRIPIVVAGTREAHNAFQVDSQISSRFEPIALPRWQDGDEFRDLLASFEVCTPLRLPSDLSEDPIASRLHAMSEGLIGTLARLLRRAAVKAIRTGREKIDEEILASLGWKQPSEYQVAEV